MTNDFDSYPRRIICLTEETTGTLYPIAEAESVGVHPLQQIADVEMYPAHVRSSFKLEIVRNRLYV
jgi:hypothetical protein